MSDLDVPIPDFLAKKGITKVSDNVPDGHEVRLPAGRIFLFFGERLMDQLQEKQRANAAAGPGRGE